MFKTRLLSGIILVIIAFATIFLGGDVLFATLLIISLIGVSELRTLAYFMWRLCYPIFIRHVC